MVRKDMTRLAARLKVEVETEVERLAGVAEETGNAVSSFRTSAPTLLEIRGLANLLHDFYTGIEKVFRHISPELNGGLPEGEAWHRRLLDNMAMDIPGVRPRLIRRETARRLDEFLRFRHVVRNIYGFELDFDRVLDLASRVEPVWAEVKTDMESFCSFLDAMQSVSDRPRS